MLQSGELLPRLILRTEHEKMLSYGRQDDRRPPYSPIPPPKHPNFDMEKVTFETYKGAELIDLTLQSLAAAQGLSSA